MAGEPDVSVAFFNTKIMIPSRFKRDIFFKKYPKSGIGKGGGVNYYLYCSFNNSINHKTNFMKFRFNFIAIASLFIVSLSFFSCSPDTPYGKKYWWRYS